ncbi:hypothetical protein [Phytohabitans aurantiacus]|uniref:CSD domain-containing protein n=1 Tax=Phytohabitans aurantiacus TaxID=3016789 RepID=A0ABQ5QLH7_9ACTN|nr:hypothetical protein [Phytohabitans aurantiacus]GLH94732.1 hypothetical protein Pa4123_00040 [Phytohabitans aurantiacus]
MEPSTTPPPPTSSAPSKPPATPSDQRPKDIVVGRVTRGGEGPCYGMVTDDGREYALYSTAGTKLAEGNTVKIRFEPLRLKIYCGPGEHISALEITVVK